MYSLKKEETAMLKQEQKPVIPKPKLRSQPIEDLTEDEAEIMIKDKGFFDFTWNKSASGFSNDYKLQHDGKVVYDHASGIMWQQSGSDKDITYKKAKSYIMALNRQSFVGYSDWRLPTLEEAMSLMEPKKNSYYFYIDPIFDTKQSWIWTSDIKPGFWTGGAWGVCFFSGYCTNLDFYLNYDIIVRAVR